MKKILGIIAVATTLVGIAATSHTGTPPARERRVVMTVTKKGFEPASVRVKAGQPLKLVVTRRTNSTCATEIVLKDYGIHQALPLNKPVEIRFTPRTEGTIRYACAMDMIAGELIVR